MKIDVVTLFPTMFSSPFEESIIKRAIAQGILNLRIHQLRDWAQDKHRLTDDRPFGGGPGMVLKPEPLFAAVKQLTQYGPSDEKLSTVILMTPSGHVYQQQTALELSTKPHLILLCGRYEGVDQRVIDALVDLELSIGDYVLTGGELPAMVVIDSVVRLLPGVLGKAESLISESFNEPLLDYPQYTQPAEFNEKKVPEILRTGDHAKIAEWRQQQAENLTQKVRPDLWNRYQVKTKLTSEEV